MAAARPRAPGRPFEQAAAGPARKSRPHLAGRDGVGSAERIAVGGNQTAQHHLLFEGAPDERRGSGQSQKLAGVRGQEQAASSRMKSSTPESGGRRCWGRRGAQRGDPRPIAGRTTGRPRPRAAWPAAPPSRAALGSRRARGRPCRAAAETLAARSRPELGRQIARGNARARGVPRRGANSAACCRGRHRPMRARPAPSSARYRRRERPESCSSRRVAGASNMPGRRCAGYRWPWRSRPFATVPPARAEQRPTPGRRGNAVRPADIP